MMNPTRARATCLRPLLVVFLFAPLACFARGSLGAEPWATYRGNPERTGCTDGKAGPQNGAARAG